MTSEPRLDRRHNYLQQDTFAGIGLVDDFEDHVAGDLPLLKRDSPTQISEFAFQQELLTDALTVADQTAGPHGRPMTVHDRIHDMLNRHGPDPRTSVPTPVADRT